MADSVLKWVMDLKDQVSGPAKQITGSLKDVEESFKNVGESATKIAEGVGLERLAEKVIDLGREFVEEAFGVRKFTEETQIAFETLTGSADEAEHMLRGIRDFSIGAALPLRDVAQAYKELQLGGVKNHDVMDAITNAAADLSHLSGGSIGTWAQTFADIQSKGDLAGRSLMAFKGVLNFDELSKRLGFHTHGYEALVKQLNATPVAADKAINSILLTLQSGEGGALGKVTKRVADTFSGTVASIKEELLSLFEYEPGPESGILTFLHGVRDALNPDGPLIAAVKAGAKSFLEGLGVFSGAGGFDDFLKKLKDGSILGSDFQGTMKSAGGAVRDVADAIGTLARGLGHVADAWRGLNALVEKGVSTIQRGGEDYGYALGHPEYLQAKGGVFGKAVGLNESIGNAASSVGGAISGANSAIGNYVEGLVPHFAEGGHVSGPTLAMIGEGGEGESVVPDSKRGGITVNLGGLQQHFHIGSEAQAMPAQDLARALHQISLSDIQGALDTAAQSMGVAN